MTETIIDTIEPPSSDSKGLLVWLGTCCWNTAVTKAIPDGNKTSFL